MKRALPFLFVALLVPAAPAAADTDYGPLKRVGVKAGPATVTGMTLRMTLAVAQRTHVRVSIVDGDRITAFAKATLRRGRHRLRLRLRGDPPAQGLQLRITALNLVTRQRGRRRRSLRVVNRAPTALALSSAKVPENTPAGTAVGRLSATDADPGQTHGFALVGGAGDNADFAIAGDQLVTAAPLDHERKPTRSVRIRVTDSAGGVLEKTLAIAVTNINEAPSSLALSNSSVAENQPAGTPVGTFSAADPDQGDTLSYALVAGRGDTDNALFAISGATLETAAELDYEQQATHSVRVRVTDAHGASHEAVFAITVRDEIEPG